MKIDDLLRFMVKQEASDLHLKPMRPPLVRIHGKLLPLKTDPLHPDLIREMILGILTEAQRKKLEEHNSSDFGYSLSGRIPQAVSLLYFNARFFEQFPAFPDAGPFQPDHQRR